MLLNDCSVVELRDEINTGSFFLNLICKDKGSGEDAGEMKAQ